MSQLEKSLMTVLVDAAFWQHVGQPERADTSTILALSHQLYQRLKAGQATTISRPSRLNSLS